MRYLPLWGILAVSFLIFALISFLDHPTLLGHEFKTMGLADRLLAERTPPIAGPEEIIITDIINDPFPVPVDTAAQTILLIGDSMLEGIGPRMAAYADHNGHTLYEVMWYSSTSEKWGKSDKLSNYIERLNPTYIMICLGANELFVPDIAQKRGQYVRKIVEQAGNIPLLWIGPPNWKPDTGINSLIESTVPAGSFFLSNGMTFERSKDGAHPTRSSAALWVDSVARWMPEHSNHPIMMEKPEVSSSKAKRIFVHQPNEN